MRAQAAIAHQGVGDFAGAVNLCLGPGGASARRGGGSARQRARDPAVAAGAIARRRVAPGSGHTRPGRPGDRGGDGAASQTTTASAARAERVAAIVRSRLRSKIPQSLPSQPRAEPGRVWKRTVRARVGAAAGSAGGGVLFRASSLYPVAAPHACRR